MVFIARLNIDQFFENITIYNIFKMIIDLVYKYIGKGISKLDKDQPIGELRYSIRSVYDHLPFIRNIYIVMPDKSIEFIDKDKNSRIIYINDNQLVDHPCFNSCVFEWNLWKLLDYGCSQCIIYLNDDYFIGRDCTPSTFFDKDRPYCLINKDLHTISRDSIYRAWSFGDIINEKHFSKHDSLAFYHQRCNSMKFVSDLLNKDIKWHLSTYFFHNALGINLNDVKKLYDLIRSNYSNPEFLDATYRGRYDLQFQELYSIYILNAMNATQKRISAAYYRFPSFWSYLKNVRKLPTLYCINTDGKYQKPTELDKERFITLMKKHYPTPFLGEITKNKYEKFQISKQNKDMITICIIIALICICCMLILWKNIRSYPLLPRMNDVIYIINT